MKRNVIETVLGGVVLVAAGVFLAFSYKSADISSGSGYNVTADFSSIGGLGVGDPVELSGVKIGTVSNIALMNESYLARVTLDIDPSIKLPTDSVALISSESLLGGRYLALQPGADEEMIPSGGHIQYTQAPQNLEELLGKFIFSMKDAKDAKGGGQQTASAEETATVPAQPEEKTAPAAEEKPVEQPAPAAEEKPAAAEPAASETPQEIEQKPAETKPDTTNIAPPDSPSAGTLGTIQAPAENATP